MGVLRRVRAGDPVHRQPGRAVLLGRLRSGAERLPPGAATAWLTQFFLPHFSETRSAVLNVMPWLAGPLMLAGVVVFFAGAIPVYWTKLRGGGAVTTGVYAWIRHPQYVGLAILGLGTLLLWPRFLVLVGRHHHAVPVRVAGGMGGGAVFARFGESYQNYELEDWPASCPQSGGTFGYPGYLPSIRAPEARGGLRDLPARRRGECLLGFGVRGYALSQVTAFYTPAAAVLSPALLTEKELRTAYQTAATDARIETALRRAGPGPLIVYVVPLGGVCRTSRSRVPLRPEGTTSPPGSTPATTRSSSRSPARMSRTRRVARSS